MGTITRRFALALATAALLVTAGCAKDEGVVATATTTPVTSSAGGGSSTTVVGVATDDLDELCGLIQEFSDAADDTDRSGEVLLEIRNAAPDDQTDDWDVLFDGFVEIAELGDIDEGNAKEAEAILTDPEFLAAAERIDAFAEDECDVDLGIGEDDIAARGPSTTTEDDEIGVPSDGSEDGTSIQALKAYIEDHHGSEVWWPVLEDASLWSAVNLNDPTYTIKLSARSDWDTLTTEELEAACNAVAEHLDDVVDSDAAVEILDPDEAVLVSRYFRGEACSPEDEL